MKRPTVEEVFQAERELRVAALEYATWAEASASTQGRHANIDIARKRLRAAAQIYARIAGVFEAS